MLSRCDIFFTYLTTTKLIRFKKEMFKLLVEHQANLEIKNNQGYTPLTLAADLCREEVFNLV